MYFICLLCDVGQKASEDEVKDKELDAIFRLPVFKLPIYTLHSLKCAPGQKEKEQESFLTDGQPFPTIHQRPVIEKKICFWGRI